MRNKLQALLLGLAGVGTGLYSGLRYISKPLPYHPFLQRDGVLVMAHRGGGGLWPQNTLYAFERATHMGVDILELDVHLSKDGALIVMHDKVVDYMTDGRGRIKDHTLSELKALDAGYTWSNDGGKTFPYRGRGIKIPTLDEIITSFPQMRLNIDIKPSETEILEPFCRKLQDNKLLDQVMVGSFHDSQLSRFREMCPRVATIAGVQETRMFFFMNSFRLGAAYQPRAYAFQIPEYKGNLRVVTPRFIKGAHFHNVQVHVWTVNEIEDMQRLIDWGVDGLITDYPDRLITLFG